MTSQARCFEGICLRGDVARPPTRESSAFSEGQDKEAVCLPDLAFRNLHFRLKASRKIGQANCLFILTLGKGQNFLSWWRATSPPQANPLGNTALASHPERGLFTGIAIVGAVGSGKNGKLHVPLRGADFGPIAPKTRPAASADSFWK